MRNDLHKILTERERHGSRQYYPQKSHAKKGEASHKRYSEDEQDWMDQQPKYERNSRRLGNSGRDFTDRLNALKGQLKKNKGKPWDDLYSQLRKTFPPNTVTHQHIYEHLFQYIAIKTKIVNDEIYVCQGSKWVSIEYEHYNTRFDIVKR